MAVTYQNVNATEKGVTCSLVGCLDGKKNEMLTGSETKRVICCSGNVSRKHIIFCISRLVLCVTTMSLNCPIHFITTFRLTSYLSPAIEFDK